MPSFYMPEPVDANHFVAGSKAERTLAQGLPTRSDFKIGKMVR
jgi:hypothetical protein